MLQVSWSQLTRMIADRNTCGRKTTVVWGLLKPVWVLVAVIIYTLRWCCVASQCSATCFPCAFADLAVHLLICSLTLFYLEFVGSMHSCVPDSYPPPPHLSLSLSLSLSSITSNWTREERLLAAFMKGFGLCVLSLLPSLYSLWSCSHELKPECCIFWQPVILIQKLHCNCILWSVRATVLLKEPDLVCARHS